MANDIEMQKYSPRTQTAEGIKNEGGTIGWYFYKMIFKFYSLIFLHSVVLSILCSLFVVGLSFLPWSGNIRDYSNYFNVTVVTTVIVLTMVLFGPWYITFYGYIINEKKITRRFLIIVVIHTIFWPTLYSLLIANGIFIWYYYLDFAYFILAFLPISMHLAYDVISDRDMKFAIKYGFSELMVIISALGYTFFLFPIFMNLDDNLKIIWRLTLHPIWFETTMLLPQRILSTIDINNIKPNRRFLPAMHSIFHNATIGRMLLLSLDNIYMSIFLITLTNIQEIIMRLSVIKRDKIFIKLLYGEKDEDYYTYGCIINMEMLFELVGIFISPVMMYSFSKYGYLFIFNGAMNSIFLNFAVQILMEVPTDLLCIIYEKRIHKMDIIKIWHDIMTKRIFFFCLYGLCTMGILGMIYTCVLLPRALYCSDYNILTCVYSPQ